MSIKKGKKQVYKVECKHKFGNTVGNTWNNVLYGNCYLCNKTVKVTPLKPKKSKKKKCNHLYDLYGKSNLCVYCRKPKPKKSIKNMYKMKIYRVYRTDNIGYDEYDAWIVRAESPAKAKKLVGWGDGTPTEAHVETELITTKGKSRVILGSFNAG